MSWHVLRVVGASWDSICRRQQTTVPWESSWPYSPNTFPESILPVTRSGRDPNEFLNVRVPSGIPRLVVGAKTEGVGI